MNQFLQSPDTGQEEMMQQVLLPKAVASLPLRNYVVHILLLRKCRIQGANSWNHLENGRISLEPAVADS